LLGWDSNLNLRLPGEGSNLECVVQSDECCRYTTWERKRPDHEPTVTHRARRSIGTVPGGRERSGRLRFPTSPVDSTARTGGQAAARRLGGGCRCWCTPGGASEFVGRSGRAVHRAPTTAQAGRVQVTGRYPANVGTATPCLRPALRREAPRQFPQRSQRQRGAEPSDSQRSGRRHRAGGG
jgi:hypothetical protein